MGLERSVVTSLIISLISFKSYAVDWFSVSQNETQNATCMGFAPPTNQQMLDFLESRIDDPDARLSTEIFGVTFKNEVPELLDLFRGIHQPSILNSKGSGKLTVKNCDKVQCAMEQLYGKKQAVKMLYIFAKYGLSTSPNAGDNIENYQKWKDSQLDDVLVALESLPPTILPLKDTFLLHYLSGYTHASYGAKSSVIANARIEVFDVWDSEPRLIRIAALVHEIGHVLGRNLDSSDEWKNMPPAKISIYAETNAAEEFAETFVAYRFAPNKLRSISKERYAFFKTKVLNGLEFKRNTDCMEPFRSLANEVGKINKSRRELVSWVGQHQADIQSEVRRQQEMGSFRKKAFEKCGKAYLHEVLTPAARELTNVCIENLFKKRAAVVISRGEDREYTERQIPISSLNDLKVSKANISRLRNDIREMTIHQLEDFFAKNYKYDWETMPACERQTDFLTRIRKDPFFAASTEAKTLLLHKACEQLEKASIFRQIFGPDFEKLRLLPY